MPDSQNLLTDSLSQAYSAYSHNCASDSDMLHKSLLRLFALELERILRKNFGMREAAFNNLWAQESCIASADTGKLVISLDDDYAVDIAKVCCA